MKTKKIVVKMLIAVVLFLSFITFNSFKASAITVISWNSNESSDFKVNYDTDFFSTGQYSISYIEDGVYHGIDASYFTEYGYGYIDGSGVIDVKDSICFNGSGTYVVDMTDKSGNKYQTEPKEFTFENELEKAENLRFDGTIVRWNNVENAKSYYVNLLLKTESDSRYKIWTEAQVSADKTYIDFKDSLVFEGSYKFAVLATNRDDIYADSLAVSTDTYELSYNHTEIDAHFGNVSSNERKYSLYWDSYPDANNYYLELSKKDGDEYKVINNVGGKVGDVLEYSFYEAMKENGEGDYRATIFGYKNSLDIIVSAETSIDITYKNCEHSYTKEIQRNYYAYELKKCPEISKYYYACEHCNEKAESEEYIYEGDILHNLANGYACDETCHWLECTTCDYKVVNNHYLDEYNYCYVCKHTVYNIWLGDTAVTSYNCDDILGDGKCFYMPETNTLVIEDYHLDGSVREGVTVIESETGYDYVAMIYAEEDLNLHIRGDNKLYEDAGDIGRQYCVYVKTGDLKISGTGSLYTNTSRGFIAHDGDIYLNLSGSISTFTGRETFICDDLFINNGTINACSFSDYVYTSVPRLDNYGGYFAEVSDSHNMTNPRPFSEDELEVKYFHIEPAMKITITPLECEGSEITKLVKKGEVYTLPECPYTAPSGKTFYKWGVDPQGLMYNAGDTITVTADTTLYPTWEKISIESISASYSDNIVAGNKINPEKISINAVYSDSSTQPISALDVEYWYNGSKIEDPVNYVFDVSLIGELSIVVKYQGFEATMVVNVIGYNVSFNANGGSGEMTLVKYAGLYTLPACEFSAPLGMQFKGWSTTSEGDVILDATYNVESNIELFAIWEDIPVIKYDITFNANGGSGEMALVEYAGIYTLPECEFIAPEGKQFKGWSTTSDGDVIASPNYDIDKDTVLYAIWEDIPVVSYDVTFNANGGSGEMALVEYAGIYTLPECEFTAPEGKQFKGWSTTSDGDVIASSTYDIDKDTVLYAIWEDIPVVSYDVTFNANGGSGEMALVEYAGIYTLPECEFTAPAGKQFKGWSTTSDGDVIASSTYDIDKDTVLYAIWEDIPHTHDYSDTWKNDSNNHYKECACGEKSSIGVHSDINNDGKCDVCEYNMPIVSTPTTAPTTTTTTTSTAPNESKNDSNAGIIAVVSVVSVLAVSGAGFGLYWVKFRKRKNTLE